MALYAGPCLECGKMNDSQYARKLCVACYHRLVKSKDFQPRKKYDGPCIICGSPKSSSGKFYYKRCNACNVRIKTTGNIIPKTKFNGPCVQCGDYELRRGYKKGLCARCYRKTIYIKTQPKYCIDCKIPIGLTSKSGRCRKCIHKSPEGRLAHQSNNRKRRAILMGSKATLTIEQWGEVLKKFDHRCAYCHKKIKLAMDHVIPISRGGPHAISNVVPACKHCNSTKRDGKPLSPVQTLLL